MTSSARANPAYSWIRANDTGDEIVGAADHAADAARTIVNEFLAGHLDTWRMIALAMTSFALLWISRGFITRLFVRKSSVQNVANVHNLFAKLFSRGRTHFLAFSSLSMLRLEFLRYPIKFRM